MPLKTASRRRQKARDEAEIFNPQRREWDRRTDDRRLPASCISTWELLRKKTRCRLSVRFRDLRTPILAHGAAVTLLVARFVSEFGLLSAAARDALLREHGIPTFASDQLTLAGHR